MIWIVYQATGIAQLSGVVKDEPKPRTAQELYALTERLSKTQQHRTITIVNIIELEG